MVGYKERLYDLYDEFDRIEDGDNRKESLKKEILGIVASVENPDDKDYHIAGLVIYFSDQKSKSDLDCAHKFFKKADKVCSKNTISRLYSAHCYHDKGDYEEALKVYLAVDGEQINKDYALGRYVKLLEQIGFCYHKTGQTAEARHYFEKVLWYYQNTDFDALVDAVELFQCLDENDPICKKIKTIENEYYHQ